MAAGNQLLTVVAKDELGEESLQTRLVAVDAAGPILEVLAPKDRQSVYTATPELGISYKDFNGEVDPGSLHVWLQAWGGGQTEVTQDLTITDEGATGTLINPLQENASYTLTVSLQTPLPTFPSSLPLSMSAGPQSLTPPASQWMLAGERDDL